MICRRDAGLQISGRPAELNRIFHPNGLQVIGLQECRAKKARRPEGEHFYVVSEPADAKGRGGCELWVTKSFGQTSEMCVCYVRKRSSHSQVWNSPKCTCFVLVFHAPRSVLENRQGYCGGNSAGLLCRSPLWSQRCWWRCVTPTHVLDLFRAAGLVR